MMPDADKPANPEPYYSEKRYCMFMPTKTMINEQQIFSNQNRLLASEVVNFVIFTSMKTGTFLIKQLQPDELFFINL